MRMWMVDPKVECRQHLLGEHGELHKHRHNFVKKHKITKRIEFGQVEPLSMKVRHDALAAEMARRGYNHASPYELPDLTYLPERERTFRVDVVVSLADLLGRCGDCRERNNGGKK